MSIGKNAIKRVENNGYSKVKTSAPDMENSSVIAAPDPQVTEKLIAPVENAAAAKNATRKSSAKKTTAKTTASAEKKTTAKIARNAIKKSSSNTTSTKDVTTQKKAYKRVKTKNTDNSVQLGKDLPYYLL